MSTEFPTPEDFTGDLGQFAQVPGFGDLSGLPDENLLQELG